MKSRRSPRAAQRSGLITSERVELNRLHRENRVLSKERESGVIHSSVSRDHLALLFSDAHQILTVSALSHRFRNPQHITGSNVAHPPRDLFETGDL